MADQHAGASAAWGLLVLAIPGFWQSVQVALPEPVAAALLLLEYFCVLKKRIVLAALLFAVSLYEDFLMLALATVSLRSAPRAMKVTLATCWTGAPVYLLLGSHDVLFIRGALFPWS